MNIPSQILTLLAGILITLISLWYGQNHGLLPVAASEEAAQVDGIFNFMMTIATGLFLLIQGVLLVSIFRFRRKPGDNTDGPPIEGNVPLEITWTAIPAIIVLVIAIYSFEVYNTMGGLDPDVSRDPGLKEVPVQEAQANSDLIALDPAKGEIALGLGASPNKVGQEPPLAIDVNGIQFAWIFKYID
ncbi:MAG: cytochrome c oxidase subunit II transmembrane domain-containing protein, partial [Chroococcales cyanobacterium]